MTRVALVHDYLLVMRGAERTFAEMAACWPDAPVYTLLHDENATREHFDGRTVVTSPLQGLGVRQRGFRALLPLFPAAASRLPVAGHDVVVSSSSAFAHGVRPDPGAVHVCYCHSPFRYAWHDRDRALAEMPRPMRPVLRRALSAIRSWDVASAERVTHYIANSQTTRQRIGDLYGRDAAVVHPPVDVWRFGLDEPRNYFLVVGELVAHKRVEVALDAARRARQPIKVVGDGPDARRLAREYEGHAEFLGRVDDRRLASLYAQSRAVIAPCVEEFGIVAVEAQAAGRPVVGVAAGGALETVVDGVTGVLVPPDDPDALAQALVGCDFDSFVPTQIRAHALRFAPEVFRSRLTAEVERVTEPRRREERITPTAPPVQRPAAAPPS